jgi:hypothetical protein
VRPALEFEVSVALVSRVATHQIDGVDLRQRSGCHLIAEPESFPVTTNHPDLVAGERERARSWATTLAANSLTEMPGCNRR